MCWQEIPEVVVPPERERDDVVYVEFSVVQLPGRPDAPLNTRPL